MDTPLFPQIQPADEGLHVTESLDTSAVHVTAISGNPSQNRTAGQSPALHNDSLPNPSTPFSNPESESISGSLSGSSLNTDDGIQQIFHDYENNRGTEKSGQAHDNHNQTHLPKSHWHRHPNRQPKPHTLFPHISRISTGEGSCAGTDSGSSRGGQKTTLDSRLMQDTSARQILAQFRAAGGKFPYVAWYEAESRDRGHSGSIFGLRGLDEYQQFVEMAALNQRIADMVAGQAGGPTPLHVHNMQEFQQLQNKLEPGGEDAAEKSPDGPETGRERRPRRPLRFAARSGKNTHYLHRTLKVRHLQMISFGGTLGVGLYLNSGKALSIAGGFGTLLAFFLVGLLVLATVNSFCEMVTFVSVVDGVSGLSSRFVDESFGFATGWLYFLSFSLGLAGEIVASIIILSYFPSTKIGSDAGVTAGFTALFLAVCFGCNMIPVSVFGEIEYLFSLFKVVITLGGIIIMIVVNRGGMGSSGVTGFRYWQHSQSDFDQNIIFGLFRPSFDLSSTGSDQSSRAIGGNLGRFLSLMAAVNIASYAYSGTEIVCIAACEAKDPRKALPSATKRVFWRILLFYCLASLVVSLNLYAGDPRLLRYYSGTAPVAAAQLGSNAVIQAVGGSHCQYQATAYSGLGSAAQSPWVVAFQTAGLCSWSVVCNVFLFLFALSCGNSHLYVSSRTAFSLALQNMAPAFLKRCNRFGTPYFAVSVSLLPALLSFACVKRSSTVVFQNLTSVISATGVFVWFAMCLSFVRFYYGLQKRPDTVARDDRAYPYRSPLQPWSAIFGVAGSALVLLSMGFVVFLDGYWNVMFFFSSYGALMVFAVLYVAHRVVKGPSYSHLESLDFDSGRRENDMYVWDGGREYNPRSFRDLCCKIAHMIA